MYNIKFTLGDPSGDGHACTSEYHMVSNYSIDDITKAYNAFVEETGLDYIRDIGSEYMCPSYIPQKETAILLEKGIISEEWVSKKDDEYTPRGCYILGEFPKEEFLNVFWNIIKYKIPDFIYKERDLQELYLDILDGAAYGFTYNGE